MVAFSAITGALRLLPIFVCIGGIGLNAFLTSTNQSQAKRIRKTLSTDSTFAKAYFYKKDTTEDTIYKGFNIGAPILMIIIWVLSIIVYGLLAIGII